MMAILPAMGTVSDVSGVLVRVFHLLKIVRFFTYRILLHVRSDLSQDADQGLLDFRHQA